jgi:hypothetical protein
MNPQAELWSVLWSPIGICFIPPLVAALSFGIFAVFALLTKRIQTQTLRGTFKQAIIISMSTFVVAYCLLVSIYFTWFINNFEWYGF